MSSSINPHYTFKYVQPEEYHFSHDSVFLARRAFELLREDDLSSFRVLDLCAGCGVIGLDFLFHLSAAGRPMPKSCDFLEVQDVYADFFAENARFVSGTELRFLNFNYAELAADRYDLILCNPPFFREGQGALSPSTFKNRCRFFLDSDFRTLLESIDRSLAGRAFILLRDLREHGVDVAAEARQVLGDRLQHVGEIRGTGLFRITGKNYSV